MWRNLKNWKKSEAWKDLFTFSREVLFCTGKKDGDKKTTFNAYRNKFSLIFEYFYKITVWKKTDNYIFYFTLKGLWGFTRKLYCTITYTYNNRGRFSRPKFTMGKRCFPAFRWKCYIFRSSFFPSISLSSIYDYFLFYVFLLIDSGKSANFISIICQLIIQPA